MLSLLIEENPRTALAAFALTAIVMGYLFLL